MPYCHGSAPPHERLLGRRRKILSDKRWDYGYIGLKNYFSTRNHVTQAMYVITMEIYVEEVRIYNME
jgi:hypothetical protein